MYHDAYIMHCMRTKTKPVRIPIVLYEELFNLAIQISEKENTIPPLTVPQIINRAKEKLRESINEGMTQ